jgi:hypothetical protein
MSDQCVVDSLAADKNLSMDEPPPKVGTIQYRSQEQTVRTMFLEVGGISESGGHTVSFHGTRDCDRSCQGKWNIQNTQGLHSRHKIHRFVSVDSPRDGPTLCAPGEEQLSEQSLKELELLSSM